MKVYIFLDNEGRLVQRSEEFIAENPNFKDLHGGIIAHWLIDSSDLENVISLIRTLRNSFGFRRGTLDAFIESLGLKPDDLLAHANNVQPR